MADLHFEHDSSDVTIGVLRSADGWTVRLPDGRTADVRIVSRDSHVAELALDGGPDQPERRYTAAVYREGATVTVSYRGRIYRFTQPRMRSESAGTGTGAVTAPCGGIVADLLVQEGDTVAAGDSISVIEAMKVMTPVEAPRAGIVRDLNVARGQRVEQGQVLARIDPPV